MKVAVCKRNILRMQQQIAADITCSVQKVMKFS